MAIRVVTLPKARPGTMKVPGGALTIALTAQSSAPTFLVLIARIRTGMPYEFVPPDRPEPRIVVGEPEAVTVVQQVFQLPVEVRRTTVLPEVMQLQLDLAVQETDAAGTPVMVGPVAIRPLVFPIFVTIDFEEE